jgi:hypothetical protein
VRTATEIETPDRATTGPSPRTATRLGFGTAALHLGALWAFAFVQPLFGLLSDSAEFFVARGNTASDIVVFALAYALAPPLVFAGVVWAAGRVRAAVGWGLHLALVALLVAAFVLPPLGDALSGSDASVAVALAVGIGAALLYRRAPVVRTFVGVLSPAPLVFLALFLVFSPVADLVWPREASGSVAGPSRSSTPIVHVILDELPVTTLERPDGRFESELFPNLARLVRHATWYRNATTVADSTPDAIPVQLTGEPPEPGALPTSRDHPQSLFTLFNRSHHMHVLEPVTDVCPADLCAEVRPGAEDRLRSLATDLRVVAEHLLLPDDMRAGLPAIDESWEGFSDEPEALAPSEREAKAGRRKLIKGVVARLLSNDATAGFARVTAALRREHDRPPLLFMHSTLPHAPWRYLPDGRTYPVAGDYPRFRSRGEDRQWLLDQSFQRHVLQVQCVDAMLGRLLRRLRATGVYDHAVIVVTADHGASFRAAAPRRLLTAGNLAAIAPVPFIVKYPGQRRGRVDDRAVRTIDVLPTIAKAAGVHVPWQTEGMPADERPSSSSTPVAVTRAGRPGQTQSLAQVRAARKERDVRESRLLRDGVFALGPRPDLVGRSVDDAAPALFGESATIDGAREYGDVEAGAPVIPAFVSGRARGLAEGAVVAVAVNGRIESTTNVLREGKRFVYGALVRPASLRTGSNRVAVLAVGADGLRTIATVG